MFIFQVNDNKNPVTKVSTLRCAIDYINSLQRLIEDSNRGVLDPALYAMDDDDEDDENENKMVTNKSKSKKDGSKAKKGQKSKKSKKRSSMNNSNNNNNKKNKNFKVRQYHASDFRSKTNGSNGKSNKSNVTLVAATRPPMSKAQLNLAIAKGLQNCKPIYTPPPPSAKKTTTTQPQPLHFPTQPLQLIQLRPLNMTSNHQAAMHVQQQQQAGQLDSSSSSSSTDAETASLQSESDYLMMPSLEVFLQPQPSPTSSSTSSMTASSPVSSGGSSEGFTTILDESHILDDIQAVLMDADNFDILV